MKSKKELTKKDFVKLMILGVGLFLLFFAMLAVAAILQENGVSSSIYTPVMLSSFVPGVIALVIMISNFGRMIEYELRVKAEKIANRKFDIVEGVTKQSVMDACEKQGFEKRDFEYYYKRKFSFSKDYVNYFVRCADGYDLAEQFKGELEKFDRKNYSNKNKCLVLFLFLDTVSQANLKFLTNQATAFILTEAAAIGAGRFDSTVLILVDNSTRKAYMVPDRASISIYKHGIKFVKKLLKQ